ncbi:MULTISPECIES: GNAT family N-acetyltransferase [Priestia]|uniref:GNAT family N-acetyltransferase n=1 Tax=Priestia TaxID=2800373 RepID=UPI0005ED1DC3|nr:MULTISPECIES: GNAT family N-acetyltransferase [Priestia]KJL04470.1 GNAT family acetyltransferase [Priestia aryabhattai B8W22]MBX4164150.1 GNAT family N-acetyltransferase [Priestia megaterium]MED3893780.1 GNAT family N-acetyltransferase [Priestia aryabhattai]
MSWCIKSFQELTNDELYEILQLRTSIFVVEQKCAYLEVDGKDKFAYHLFKKENKKIIAYLRVLPKGISYKEASLGRIIVKQAQRGTGLGRELVARGIDFLENELHEKTIKIQAQSRLQKFYESFGFKPISDIYADEGLPHVDMLKTP